MVCKMVFRLLLFSNLESMQKFRDPKLYAAYDSEDNYWKLYHLFGGEYGPPANPHPELGWVGRFSRDTFVHDNSAAVGARTPVLFYGDSFTECSTLPDKSQCFEGLFNNDSGFTQNHYLLNYGVGRYGLDQIFLLLRRSVPHYKKPFVIVGIMTWDLDRSAHSVRIGQKPFFSVEEEGLVLKGVPINPNSSEFFAQHPPEIWSYLLRLWAQGDGPLWKIRRSVQGIDERYRRMANLNEAILLEIIRELRREDLPHLFVIFYPDWIYQDPPDWRELLIKKVLAGNDERYISTRELVADDSKRTGLNPQSQHYYSEGHPTAYQYQLIAEQIKQHVFLPRVGGN